MTLTSGRADIRASYKFAYDRAGLRLTASVPMIALDDIGMQGQALFRGTTHVDGLTVDGGQIRLSGPSWIPDAIHVEAGQIAFHGASLTGPALARNRPIRLVTGTLAKAALDYAGRRINLGVLELGGLDLPVRRGADGTIDVMGLLPTAAGSTAPVKETPAWAFHLDQARLANAAVHVEDRAVAPMARFDLTAASLAVSDLGSDLGKPVNLRFATRVNGAAQLSGQGMITPQTSAGQLQLALAALPVSAILPYLPTYPKLDIRSGQLGAKGLLTLSGGKGPVRFAGDASLDRFAVYQTGIDTPIAAWGRLSMTGLRYSPDRVDIAAAQLSSPSGRLALMPDRTFNVMALMAPPSTGSATGASGALEPPAVGTGTASPAPVAVAVPAPVPESPALPVHLRQLTLEGGTLDFADYSISPNFEARIDALRGTIRNITNAPNAVASVDLQGQVVDRFSPVAVKGTVNLFSYDKATDIEIGFHNIELPIFNPYSGVYAGYSIAKGKLSTEFSYRIANRALQAEHHIVIDQLQWGQATANKARVPWPVRLATALMKDRNGVIKLDVPVKGSLDEPTFRLAPIVWKIIGNVIEKAVTAPFRLIGSLFAGAEKAQFVDFVPGSADLPIGSNESLAALAKGLAERPGLNLDIPVGPGMAADATAIADARIDTAAIARDVKKGIHPDFGSLQPNEQHDRLQALYKLRFHGAPHFPDEKQDASGTEAKSQRKTAETQWLRAELRKSFAPSQKDLETLGAARGSVIRDALLAKGDIDPVRIFLSASAPLTETDGRVRFELKLR